MEKGLSDWREASWFLKENESSWALGTTPNLTNMHVRAMARINEDQITENLEKRIRDATLVVTSDTVAVHTLPQSPADIPDNPELHFVVAGPTWTAVPGEDVSDALATFFNRTYRNTVIVLAPENARLIGLRQRIRKILAWQNIESGDDMNLLSEPQKAILLQRKHEDESGILESVISAYSVLIAIDEDGDVKASLLPSGPESPFEPSQSCLVEEDRLLRTSLDPDLLTPDSTLISGEKTKPQNPFKGCMVCLQVFLAYREC